MKFQDHSTRITAFTLLCLYNRQFERKSASAFRLEWSEYEAIAGKRELPDQDLSGINNLLKNRNLTLVPYENYLAVLLVDQTCGIRKVPKNSTEARQLNIIKQMLYDRTFVYNFDDFDFNTETTKLTLIRIMDGWQRATARIMADAINKQFDFMIQ